MFKGKKRRLTFEGDKEWAKEGRENQEGKGSQMPREKRPRSMGQILLLSKC